jgi:beta-lactamase regulating signal transducer with metallopeptidase domain
MTFSYGIRLACLCLEIIFLVNLAASIVVLGLSRRAAQVAMAMRPHRAARLFFTLRLLPFVSSLCVIASLCIPSYLRYEQDVDSERIGLFCLVTAALGLILCLSSVYKGIRALAQLYSIEQRCRLLPPVPSPIVAETRMCLAAEDGSNMPLLALVGILRPRLIVSRRLLETLSAEQLEAALFHERAHKLSWDNLKRLFLVVAPGILPFMGGFSLIEQQWERYAELAADAYATCGRIDRSIALAEALIQVARLGNIERRIPLASSLSAHNLELALRVDRLMAIDSATPLRRRGNMFSWNSFLVFVAFATFLVLLPEVLYPLHRLLESLLH